MRLSPFWSRILLASLAMLLFAFSAFWAHTPDLFWVTLLVLVGLATAALYEFLQMTDSAELPFAVWLGCLGGVGYLLARFCAYSALCSFADCWAVLGVGLAVLLLFCLFARRQDMARVAGGVVLGWTVVTLPLGCLIDITYGPWTVRSGEMWLVFVVVVTKSTDVFAWGMGKWLGKTPFFSQVSPKKTREGAVGGLVGSLLMALLLDRLSGGMVGTGHALALGVGLSLLAQAGDLIESWLKRNAGVKDSGKLPGIGGALDMVDSLLLAAPAMVLYLRHIPT